MSRVHVRFDEGGEVVEYRLGPSDDQARRGLRALALANDIETCRALMAGQSVPFSRLCPEWVKRFGLRP